MGNPEAVFAGQSRFAFQQKAARRGHVSAYEQVLEHRMRFLGCLWRERCLEKADQLELDRFISQVVQGQAA